LKRPGLERNKNKLTNHPKILHRFNRRANKARLLIKKHKIMPKQIKKQNKANTSIKKVTTQKASKDSRLNRKGILLLTRKESNNHKLIKKANKNNNSIRREILWLIKMRNRVTKLIPKKEEKLLC